MAALPSVTILGAGRMGQGLALALRGVEVLLVSRRGHPVAAGLRLHTGTRAQAVARGRVVILAVPDDAVTSLAADLAAEGAVGADHTVLHLSGLLDRRALWPLTATGAALGSFHPLQTIADPAAAPERLAGAYAGLEGDRRAVEVGSRLAGRWAWFRSSFRPPARRPTMPGRPSWPTTPSPCSPWPSGWLEKPAFLPSRPPACTFRSSGGRCQPRRSVPWPP